jgi:hypothetical protein
MRESFKKLQKMSKGIIKSLASNDPDKKAETDKKHSEYENELNVFKLHTAEYLAEQQKLLVDPVNDEKAMKLFQKKIEVASKLQEKVQQIQDDMVDAFVAEMNAEVARIVEEAKKAEMENQLQEEIKENKEIKAPELEAPELGDHLVLKH